MKELFSISNPNFTAKCVRDCGDIKIQIYKKLHKGYAPQCIRTEFVDAPLHVETSQVMTYLRLQAHCMLEGAL